MPPRSYATPEGFRQALETRVRAAAGSGGMGRFRQVLVYDRFPARIFQHLGDRAVAKGGVVLELRLERARTTRDVDIHLRGPSEASLPSYGPRGASTSGTSWPLQSSPIANTPPSKATAWPTRVCSSACKGSSRGKCTACHSGWMWASATC